MKVIYNFEILVVTTGMESALTHILLTDAFTEQLI